MNNIKIEIDSNPILDVNPILNFDYTSKFFNYFLYEPLIQNYNCFLYNNNNDKYILIFLKNNLEPILYKNAIKYHLHSKNKSPYIYFFLNIVGSTKFYKNINKDLTGVKIVNSNTLYIKYHDSNINIIKVLTSFLVLPMYKNKIIRNGKYSLVSKSKNKYILLKNKNYWKDSYLIDKVIFVKNKKFKNSISLYKKNKLDITCFSSFNYLIFKNLKLKLEINYLESSIFYILKFKNKKLKNIIKNKFFFKNYFFTLLLNNKKSNISQILTSYNHEIKILYPNYYPNNLIISKIIEILKSYKIKLKVTKVTNMKKFYEESKKNYDIILFLNSPIIEEYKIFFLSMYKNKNFIHELFNKTLNFKDIINNINLDNENPFLILGKGKFIFLKNKFLNLKLNKFGKIDINKIYWSKNGKNT